MIRRRNFITAAALAAAAAGTARAQGEARPMRIVVPAPPGGTLDGSARVLAQKLAAISGEPVVVENKPGGQTAVGTSYVAQAAPDGRTLLWTSSSFIINPLLEKVPYSPLTDFTPVAGIAFEPIALIASSRSGFRNLRELDASARAAPARLSCAAPPGAMSLACGELRQRWGDGVVVAPYPGVAPVLQAVAGGHVDLAFVSLEAAEGLLKSGQVRLLAVSRHLPGSDAVHAAAPLVRDVVPEILGEGLYAVYVPAATARERMQALEQLFARALRDNAVLAQLRALGLDVLPDTSSEALAAQLGASEAMYAAWVRRLGLARP